MKKIRILIFIFLLFVLSSCSSNIEDVATLIDMPTREENFLTGTWKVSKIEKQKSGSDSNRAYDIGDKLYISNDIVAIDEDYTLNPNYSAKYVNLKDYLKSRDFSLFKDIKTNDLKVIVLNASEGQLYSRDFIVFSENEIAFIENSFVYYLSKNSEKVDKKIQDYYISKNKDFRSFEKDDNSKKTDITVLLGTREKVNIDGNPTDQYNYYTYAVRLEPNLGARKYKTSNLFFPNKQEFWKLELPVNSATGMHDRITAYPVRLEEEIANNPETKLKYTYMDYKKNIKLNYLQEDRASFEYTNPDDEISMTKYAILKLEQLSQLKPLSINEITGTDNVSNFEDTVMKQINKDFGKVGKKDINEIDPTNVGIVRNQGIWQFETSYQIKADNNIKQKSFPIDMTIEGKKLNEKKRIINWDQIKNKNPQAIDYFESYNNQYIIIQDADEILVYGLKNGVITNTPLISIQTPTSTQIVMCEWAGGEYANKWENAFKQNELINEY